MVTRKERLAIEKVTKALIGPPLKKGDRVRVVPYLALVGESLVDESGTVVGVTSWDADILLDTDPGGFYRFKYHELEKI